MICGKLTGIFVTYKNIFGLRIHLSTTHTLEERKLSCKECGDDFIFMDKVGHKTTPKAP